MNPYQPNVDPRDPGSFSSHAAWKRTLVVAAGSAANAVVALTVLVCLYISGTHVPVPMTVGTVEPGSPAARSQIRPGDFVSEIDGRQVHQWSSLVQTIADNPGSEVQLGIVRRGEGLQVTVRPQRDEQGVGRLGIAQQYVFRRHPVGLAARQSVAHALHLAIEGTAAAQRLLRGQGSREMLRQAAASAEQGWDGRLRAMVNLSLLMAAFFLLPFPGLDGGRLVFLLTASASPGRELRFQALAGEARNRNSRPGDADAVGGVGGNPHPADRQKEQHSTCVVQGGGPVRGRPGNSAAVGRGSGRIS